MDQPACEIKAFPSPNELEILTTKLLEVYGPRTEDTPITENDKRDADRDLSNVLNALDSYCSTQEIIEKAAEKIHDGWVEAMSSPYEASNPQVVQITGQEGFPQEFEIFADAAGTISVVSMKESNNTERRAFALKGVTIPETFLQTPNNSEEFKGTLADKLKVYLTYLKDKDSGTHAKLITVAQKRYNQMRSFNDISAAEKMKDIARVTAILSWLGENIEQLSDYITPNQAARIREYLKEKENWIILEKPDEHYYSLQDTAVIKELFMGKLFPARDKESDADNLKVIEETYLEYVRYKLNYAFSGSCVFVLTFEAFGKLCSNSIGENDDLDPILGALGQLYQNDGDINQLKSEITNPFVLKILQEIFAATCSTVEA